MKEVFGSFSMVHRVYFRLAKIVKPKVIFIIESIYCICVCKTISNNHKINKM